MFQDERLYSARDSELNKIIPYSTLATWRFEGRGPAFIKIGPKVFYRGDDLNRFLQAHRVEPVAASA